MKVLLVALLTLISISALAELERGQFVLGKKTLFSRYEVAEVLAVYTNGKAFVNFGPYAAGGSQIVKSDSLSPLIRCSEKSDICIGDNVNYKDELFRVVYIFENDLVYIYNGYSSKKSKRIVNIKRLGKRVR